MTPPSTGHPKQALGMASRQPSTPVTVVVETESDGWMFFPGVEGVSAAQDLCIRAAQAAWAKGLMAHQVRVSQAAEVCILLADDAVLRDLNTRFRGQDKATNVLSFPLLDPFADAIPESGSAGFMESQTGYAPLMVGDIAIALETVLAEAHTQGKSPSDHLAHLVVHGVLHLMGHDHEDDCDAQRMEALEIEILGGMGIADPYAESASAAV